MTLLYKVVLSSEPATRLPAKGAPGNAGPPVPVITQKAPIETFIVRRRTIGWLETPAAVVVRPRIDSQLLEQHVTDGQFVRTGQLMFTLDDREIKATIARDEAQLAKDMAALAQAKGQLDRTATLNAKGISPKQQLEQADAANKAAQQTVEADQAVLDADRLRLGYATIKAPMDGRLGVINTSPGNLVSSNDTNGLVTITRLKPLRVSFTLPEADLVLLRSAIRRKPPAVVKVFTTQSSDDVSKPAEVEKTPAATGDLDFVDNTVDVNSGTIIAKATLANEDYSLWPGQFVDVEIELATRPATVMLPTTSILMGQQGPYVFMARDDASVEIRQVRVGGTADGRTAILEGIKLGERVIVDGQVRVSANSRWTEAKKRAAGKTFDPPKPAENPTMTGKGTQSQP